MIVLYIDNDALNCNRWNNCFFIKQNKYYKIYYYICKRFIMLKYKCVTFEII